MRNLKVKTPKAPVKAKNNTLADDEEDDQLAREIQYKSELLWCQDYIRRELEKAKTDRQKETLIKGFNVLVNPKASMVHKRQVMSQSCGNYRNQMAQEVAKSTSLPSSLKVLNIAKQGQSPATSELQCTFLKRRQAKMGDDGSDKESTSDFKFDFWHWNNDNE